MIRNRLLAPVLLSAFSCLAFFLSLAQQKPSSFLIINAQLADGTGAPLRKANVRIDFNHIAEIGDLAPQKNETVIDAKGLVLAPGFIDIHNHSEEGILTDPVAETQIAQGITSLVVGADGESPWPIIHWVRNVQQLHTAPNISVFAGHATIREQVMGKDFKRPATAQEIQTMQQLVSQAMNQQAIGLSSGLEYEVGGYSNTDELVALAKTAAGYRRTRQHCHRTLAHQARQRLRPRQSVAVYRHHQHRPQTRRGLYSRLLSLRRLALQPESSRAGQTV
jgi:N-acyl-D-amino-acid deacylase